MPCGACGRFIPRDGSCRHIKASRTHRKGTKEAGYPMDGISAAERRRMRNREYKQRMRDAKRLV